MVVAQERLARTAVEESGAARWFRWLSWLMAGLVLVQSILAGRGMFVNPDLFGIHELVGNVIFLAVIALVVLAFVARRRGALGGPAVGVSALLLVLAIAQIGLGYAGRESGTAASLHVPNGVLIFGLSVALLALASPRRPASAV